MPHRPLHSIAAEIRKDWKKVNYAAAPYLDAMCSMGDISEPYYADEGKSVVLYFLCNAGSWKGPVARAIKAELRGMCK